MRGERAADDMGNFLNAVFAHEWQHGSGVANNCDCGRCVFRGNAVGAVQKSVIES
jgi:hypothetical protein